MDKMIKLIEEKGKSGPTAAEKMKAKQDQEKAKAEGKADFVRSFVVLSCVVLFCIVAYFFGWLS